MNCQKVQNLISAYVDCELSGQDMLAVRHHLSKCDECNLEFESVLTIKRSLGAMRTPRPSANLAVNICREISIASESQKNHIPFWQRNITIFTDKLRYATVGAGVFCMLLLLGSGSITSNDYKNDSTYPGGIGALIEEDAISLFDHDPIIKTVSMNSSDQHVKSFNLPWGLSHAPARSSAFNESHFLLANYSNN